MKWYEKFKVGEEVKVIKRVRYWTCGGIEMGWNNEEMDKTICKTYKINEIDKYSGYRLSTDAELDYNYYYPVESLACVKGTQLLFNFMHEE